MTNLKEKYYKTVAGAMKEKFGYKSVMATPRMVKVVLSAGTGSFKDEAKKPIVEKSLAAITGQKPLVNKAKKSIASFKLREGMPIGYSVTLRGGRMYDFLDKLINITMPRVKDFRGINPEAIDDSGNLTIGFKDHVAFPETAGDDARNAFGLGITLVTSAKSKEEAVELLKLIGIPFYKNEQ